MGRLGTSTHVKVRRALFCVECFNIEILLGIISSHHLIPICLLWYSEIVQSKSCLSLGHWHFHNPVCLSGTDTFIRNIPRQTAQFLRGQFLGFGMMVKTTTASLGKGKGTYFSDSRHAVSKIINLMIATCPFSAVYIWWRGGSSFSLHEKTVERYLSYLSLWFSLLISLLIYSHLIDFSANLFPYICLEFLNFWSPIWPFLIFQPFYAFILF